MGGDASHDATEQALPLYRVVENALRDAVTTGMFAPGGVLSEATVSSALGISRTPAKLALLRLADEGLLAKGPGRGFVIGTSGAQPLRRLRQDDIAEALSNMHARRAATWETIYDDIEREVAGLSVFGPLRLVESHRARDHGVSRTVAHEVFMRLERLGLIAKDESGRWNIVAMTPERVRQIYDVRCLLEPAAISWAAHRIPNAELAAMRTRLADVQARYPDVSIQELDRLEQDIHLGCVGWCGNDELVNLLRINQTLLIHNKHMLSSYLELPQIDPFMNEHVGILDRLVARDGPGAAEAMRAHLAAALPTVLERLERLRKAGPPKTSLLVT